MHLFVSKPKDDKDIFLKLATKINECHKDALLSKKIMDKKMKEDKDILNSNKKFIDNLTAFLKESSQNTTSDNEEIIEEIQNLLNPKKQKTTNNEETTNHIDQYIMEITKLKTKISERNKLLSTYVKFSKEILYLEKKGKENDPKMSKKKKDRDTTRKELSETSDVLVVDMKNAIIAHTSFIRSLIKFSVHHICEQEQANQEISEKIMTMSKERETKLIEKVTEEYDRYEEQYNQTKDEFIDKDVVAATLKANKKVKPETKTSDSGHEKKVENDVTNESINDKKDENVKKEEKVESEKSPSVSSKKAENEQENNKDENKKDDPDKPEKSDHNAKDKEITQTEN
ncbi:hypothetical protein A3Q56_01588 [Intoshia linei]|uniref:Uncharacterized protein n=1 Tax=Intoshia linei TaxID=1819745 RepID=A0A177BAH5_9BILA|nr:hypothetical protein A3Q56_01588 [Intoshia linei]